MKREASGTPRFSTWVITLMTVIALFVTVTLLGCDTNNRSTHFTCFHCGKRYGSGYGGQHTDCRYCDRPICLGSHGEGVCNKTDGDVLCPQCNEKVKSTAEHWQLCEREHYSCDGKSHEKLTCSHTDSEGNVTEHYACDGLDHKTPAECGEHPKCSSHTELSCGEGHFACDGRDHTHYYCGTKHYACDGANHEILGCGHAACASGSHDKLTCGHYACNSLMGCGHCSACTGTDGHSRCSVGGEWLCYGGDDHSVGECGHLMCGEAWEAAHIPCPHCDGCSLTGEHGVGICPSFPCGYCGWKTVTEGEHRGACGMEDHYTCRRGADHSLCPYCNTYYCGYTHGILECGHYICDSGASDGVHEYLPCGHWSHNGVPFDGMDHSVLPCGHPACHNCGCE